MQYTFPPVFHAPKVRETSRAYYSFLSIFCHHSQIIKSIFELGCQQTPEYGGRQAQPPQHLGKALHRTLSPPSSLLSLAESSSRNNVPHSPLLSRIPSYNLPDFLSFTALDRICPHLVWCGWLQHSTAPATENLLSPRLVGAAKCSR